MFNISCGFESRYTAHHATRQQALVSWASPRAGWSEQKAAREGAYRAFRRAVLGGEPADAGRDTLVSFYIALVELIGGSTTANPMDVVLRLGRAQLASLTDQELFGEAYDRPGALFVAWMNGLAIESVSDNEVRFSNGVVIPRAANRRGFF